MAKTILKDPRKIKFKPSAEGFLAEVRRRVEAYFKENNLSRQADWGLWLKTGLLLALNAAFYIALLSNHFGFLGVIVLYSLFGMTTSFICINIIHDVLHGSFFKSKFLNKCLGYFFDFQGFSSKIWEISHNLDHHTYTNISGIDQDIDKMFFLRLAPTDGFFSFHRFQHLYALPLYTFTTLNWAHYTDYLLMRRYWKEGKASNKDLGMFILFKVLYLMTYIAIPIFVISLPWWQTFLGYVLMQMVGGLIAAVVFQLAHVVEGVEYPLPDENGHMDYAWAIHEMKTTSNFATHSAFTSQLFGGLNFQIEHHLFPHISHVHYYRISPLVRETAQEYGLPYNSIPTFWKAVYSHLRILKKFAQVPVDFMPSYSTNHEI